MTHTTEPWHRFYHVHLDSSSDLFSLLGKWSCVTLFQRDGRWKNAVFVTWEIWFSKDKLLSNITPRFLTVEEVTGHLSNPRDSVYCFFGPISNISVLSEFCKGWVLVKRCGASGPTVEALWFWVRCYRSEDISPMKALARSGPTVEKCLMSAATLDSIGGMLQSPTESGSCITATDQGMWSLMRFVMLTLIQTWSLPLRKISLFKCAISILLLN